MKLFAKRASYAAQKVLVTAEYAGVDVEAVTEVSEKKLKVLSPLAKLPVLETPEGVISNSNAISKFVAKKNAKLVGSTDYEAAMIDSWVEFCANEIELPSIVVSYSIIGWMEMHSVAFEKARKDLNKALQTLESHLKTRTFLVGESITLADITVATSLVLPFKLVLDPKNRKTFSCVTRWYTTLINQSEFIQVIGAPELCAKSLAPEAAPAPKSKPAQKKKEKKPKAEAAAPPPPAPKKKEKHYAELLPPTSMNLDAWKRQYSNAPGGDCYKAMPWFWENLDKDGYSLFFGDYKYKEELEVEFMISNLAGGFVQRCDEIRKYAFGVLQILKEKEANKFEIKSAWLFRGDSEKMILDSNPDGETYEWVKADPTNEEHKKRIEDLWCAGEEIEGMLIADCKVFK